MLFRSAKSLQSCPTLCDPVDGSSPGSPVPVLRPINLPPCFTSHIHGCVLLPDPARLSLGVRVCLLQSWGSACEGVSTEQHTLLKGPARLAAKPSLCGCLFPHSRGTARFWPSPEDSVASGLRGVLTLSLWSTPGKHWVRRSFLVLPVILTVNSTHH